MATLETGSQRNTISAKAFVRICLGRDELGGHQIVEIAKCDARAYPLTLDSRFSLHLMVYSVSHYDSLRVNLVHLFPRGKLTIKTADFREFKTSGAPRELCRRQSHLKCHSPASLGTTCCRHPLCCTNHSAKCLTCLNNACPLSQTGASLNRTINWPSLRRTKSHLYLSNYTCNLINQRRTSKSVVWPPPGRVCNKTKEI